MTDETDHNNPLFLLSVKYVLVLINVFFHNVKRFSHFPFTLKVCHGEKVTSTTPQSMRICCKVP